MNRALPLLLASALAACSTTPPREPVNHLLHEVAHAYHDRDLDALLAHYDPQGQFAEAFLEPVSEPAPDGVQTRHGPTLRSHDDLRATLAREFAHLGHVAKAKLVLDDIREVDGGWEVETLFRFYGNHADGRPLHQTADLVLTVVPHGDDGWRIASQRVVRRTVTESGGPSFEERSYAAGLDVVHQPHTPIDDSTPIIPGNFTGAGVAAGDVDHDGDLDLLIGDGVRARLFLNRGDGTFTDGTTPAGLGASKVRGAYLVHLDEDEHLDVVFTRAGPPPLTFRGRGDGTFEPTEWFAQAPPGQYESAAFADLDGDGDLDAFLVRYGDFYTTSWAFPIYDAQDGVPDVALRNDGQGRFTRVDDPVLTPPGWGLACAIADVDGDLDPDVYIVNDFGVNHLLRNDGDWQFTEVTEESNTADQGLGMSAAFGDYDHDGDLDIYVANMNSNSRWVFEDPDFPLPVVADLLLRGYVRGEMYKVTRGNSLLQNQGDGTFVQVADALGVRRAEWAWGADFLDVDNDGDLDIYCPNGFITGTQAPDQ